MDGIVVGNKLANQLSLLLKCFYSPIEIVKFSDGELKPRIIKPKKTKWGILVLDIHQDEDINGYLIIFLLLAARLKILCKNVIGIVPYLPYNRQDKEFLKGESISAKVIASHLEKNLDFFVTFNSHSHHLKLKNLFTIPIFDLSLFKALSQYFIDFSLENTLVIGPDEESRAFVKDFCYLRKFPFVICQKKRDVRTNKLKIRLPKNVKIKNKDIIIVDDIIASGQTFFKLVRQIKKQKPKSISCVFAHGLLVGKTEESLIKLKLNRIFSSDTIDNPFMRACSMKVAVPVIKTIIKNQL